MERSGQKDRWHPISIANELIFHRCHRFNVCLSLCVRNKLRYNIKTGICVCIQVQNYTGKKIISDRRAKLKLVI